MHIFISYAKKDTRDLALRLRAALEALPAVTAWMDVSLETGESWASQIQHEIDRCDVVVVLLSPDVNRPITPTQTRSFVLNEIDYAQGERKPIIPVMAQRTKMPVQIAGIQYVDYAADPAQGVQQLVEAIAKRAGLSLPPPEPRPSDETTRRDVARHVPAQPAPQAASAFSRGRLAAGALALAILAVVGLAALQGRSSGNGTPTSILALTTAVAVNATVAARQTQSAAQTATAASPTPSHTPTPTEDIEATVNAALTATAVSKPVTSNKQWTPITQSFKGVEMVLVPPGCFMMGSTDGGDNEEPVNKQCFDQPFWIDKTEVTNAQFEQFKGQTANKSNWTDPQRPRERITWFEARDFCLKRGARLPTEREWEYAARGPDNLKYPWGNDFVADNVVYGGNSNNQTVVVGSRPGDVSWVGALDMSGNVSEWVSTIYNPTLFPYPYKADDGRENNSITNGGGGLRGGSWYFVSDGMRAARRDGLAPSFGHSLNGLRCARLS